MKLLTKWLLKCPEISELGDSWAKNLAIWFLMVLRTWTLNNQTEQEEIWTSKWTWEVSPKPKQNSVKVHFARHASYGDHQSHAKSPLMSPVVSYRNNCHHFRIIFNLPIFAGEIAHLPDLQAFAASTNALLGWVRQLRALEAWMLSSIVHLTSLSNLSTYVHVYIWIYYMYGYSISISTYTMYVMYIITYIYIYVYTCQVSFCLQEGWIWPAKDGPTLQLSFWDTSPPISDPSLLQKAFRGRYHSPGEQRNIAAFGTKVKCAPKLCLQYLDVFRKDIYDHL